MMIKKNIGMVDISAKPITARRAVASGCVTLSIKAFNILITDGSPKGDVIETARLAGIMSVKKTPDILPLCHPILIEKTKVSVELNNKQRKVIITAEVYASGKTGVEMEALTAVSAACLCVYDMMKFAGQDMRISDINLTHKSGGKSGVYNK